MKNGKPLTKLKLLAVLLTLGLAVAQADILAGVSIGFAPVGLTMDQTARLNLVNVGVPNGILITLRFMDASGAVISKPPQEQLFLPFGKIVSVDFKRHLDPLPKTDPAGQPKTDPAGQLRAEVRAQIEILTSGVSSESLRRSLEVFNNDTGATTVCMGGAAP
jgi:hypothetical protein